MGNDFSGPNVLPRLFLMLCGKLPAEPLRVVCTLITHPGEPYILTYDLSLSHS